MATAGCCGAGGGACPEPPGEGGRSAGPAGEGAAGMAGAFVHEPAFSWAEPPVDRCSPSGTAGSTGSDKRGPAGVRAADGVVGRL
eukprot:4601251-Alexandrium_andersonii.AAC.1